MVKEESVYQMWKLYIMRRCLNLNYHALQLEEEMGEGGVECSALEGVKNLNRQGRRIRGGHG